MSDEYEQAPAERAQIVFFNRWNAQCSHPGCTADATTIVTAIVPSSDSHRAVSSACDEHARGRALYLVRELGFVQLGNGVLMNMREQARIMREIENGGIGGNVPELVPNERGMDNLRHAFLALEAAGADNPMTVDCESHGTTPWRGELVCEACDRLYRLPLDDSQDGQPELLEPENPPFCDCGKPLTPGPDDEHAESCTGMVVCPGCFEAHKPRRTH